MRAHAQTPEMIVFLWCVRLLGIWMVVWIGYCTIWLWPIQEDKNIQTEVVFLLDISKSMETDDIKPSRLEKAKAIIEENMLRRNTKIGYVIFAGKAFILSPLTSDMSGLGHIIRSTTIDTIDQSVRDTSGTNIGDALITGMSLFSFGKTEKSIVLLTDGRANIGLEPTIAVDELRKNTISLSTIAIGSLTGSILSYRDSEGKSFPLLDSSGLIQSWDIDFLYLDTLTRRWSGSIYHIEKNWDVLNLGGELMENSDMKITDFLVRNHKLILSILAILVISLTYVISYWYKTR
jgi:Ca-activated chloride channel homolog